MRVRVRKGASHPQEAGGHFRRPALEVIRLTWLSLFALVCLDLFLDFPLHRVQIERGWRLHWRKFDGGFRQLRYLFLDENEAPKFSRIKRVHVPTTHVVQAFAADRRRSFERVLAEVDHPRHVGRDLFPWPAVRLLEKLEFVIINSKGTQLWTGEVENLMPCRRSLAEQQIDLVVAVKVILVGTVTELHPFEELNPDVGVAGRVCQGR